MVTLTDEAAQVLFTLPENDGRFDPSTRLYLRDLGRRRPVVVLAFPPKAAGTFFREAVNIAVGGQLVRAVHAQGGRDAQLYLPNFIAYYLGVMPDHVFVTHVHMQALPANIHFLEAFDIRPVVMMRSIPDMLASYWDMLESDPVARADGLNCRIPQNFPELSDAAKADFLTDILGPWYASFFATWLAYDARAPHRVCLLHYRDFREDPAEALDCALEHVGLVRPLSECEAAIEKATAQRQSHRFNKGERGRGHSYLQAVHVKRLERQLGHYPNLAPHLDELLGRGAFAA